MQAGQAKLAMCDDTCGSLIQLSQPTRTLVCGFSRTYRASSARATEDLALRPLGCLASARCEQERNLVVASKGGQRTRRRPRGTVW
jgi:hypothetical protein